MLCLSWKPIQGETRQTWKKSKMILSKNYEIECEDFHTSTRASAGESEMEITLELCFPDR